MRKTLCGPKHAARRAREKKKKTTKNKKQKATRKARKRRHLEEKDEAVGRLLGLFRRLAQALQVVQLLHLHVLDADGCDELGEEPRIRLYRRPVHLAAPLR